MLYYADILWLKKFFDKTVKIGIVLILLALLTYSCDWDFPLRVALLPETDANYPEEMAQTSTQRKMANDNNPLGLEIISQFQVTGKFLGANADILRATCPFRKKDDIRLYNKYFKAIILSVKGSRQDFAAIGQSRLIKQLLSKLADDEDFLREKLDHKITLIGHTLKLHTHQDIGNRMPHVMVTQVILDGKIYE